MDASSCSAAEASSKYCFPACLLSIHKLICAASPHTDVVHKMLVEICYHRLAAVTFVTCPDRCMFLRVFASLQTRTPILSPRVLVTCSVPQPTRNQKVCTTHQSRPSYKPSPRIEIAPCTCQLLFLSCPKPRASQTSAVVKAPFCKQAHQVQLNRLQRAA